VSRDIFVQDIPAGIASVEEIPDDWMPAPLRYRQSDVIAAVVEIEPGADVSDPGWLRVDPPGANVEVNVEDDDPLMGFALHVRGDAAASDGFVSKLLAALGSRAFDVEADNGLFGST
jgi:hypothetical protein